MGAPARRGGRPSREQAARLQERILAVATDLFLSEGYGATTIEAVARRARISKRTLYHRFKDKAELFEAAMRHLIGRWLPPFEARLVEAGTTEELLRQVAAEVLAVALTPPALALYRLLLAEAQRFPVLMRAMNEAGARAGVERIAALLERGIRAGEFAAIDSRFAAEQFLILVISAPRSRALGLGEPMNPQELERWTRATVDLFLRGCRG